MTNSIAVKNVVEVEVDFSSDVVIVADEIKSFNFTELKLKDFEEREVRFLFSKEMVCTNRPFYVKIKNSQEKGGLLTPSFLTSLVREADEYFNRHCAVC